MNTSTLAKWWNSYAVRIPRETLRRSGYLEGASFDVDIDWTGTILLKPTTDNFDHLYAQMSEENQHELIGPTHPVGKENILW